MRRESYKAVETKHDTEPKMPPTLIDWMYDIPYTLDGYYMYHPVPHQWIFHKLADEYSALLIEREDEVISHLEPGIGLGYFSLQVLQKIDENLRKFEKRLKVWGVDKNKNLLAVLKENLKYSSLRDRMTWDECDIESRSRLMSVISNNSNFRKYAFEAGDFQSLGLLWVVHHFEDWKSALTNLISFIGSGALVYLIEEKKAHRLAYLDFNSVEEFRELGISDSVLESFNVLKRVYDPTNKIQKKTVRVTNMEAVVKFLVDHGCLQRHEIEIEWSNGEPMSYYFDMLLRGGVTNYRVGFNSEADRVKRANDAIRHAKESLQKRGQYVNEVVEFPFSWKIYFFQKT